MPIKILVSTLLAIFILGVYVVSIVYAIEIAHCVHIKCGTHTAADFHAGWSNSAISFGGLVSALVVAELAITKPGQVPAMRLATEIPGNHTEGVIRVVSVIYLLTWLVAGAAAYVAGELLYFGSLPALSDMAKTWFGLAIAAVYAYFGIKP